MSTPRRWNGWVASYLLPLSSANIGRVVPDRAHPDQDFYDTTVSITDSKGVKDSVSMAHTGPFHNQTIQSRSNGVSGLLTGLLGAKYNVQKEEIVDIVAENCTTRTLPNAADHFKIATECVEVKEWLERTWKEKKKIHFITGIKTLTNAKIKLHVSRSRASGYKAHLPGSLVLAAATHGVITSAGGLEAILDSDLGTEQAKDTKLIGSVEMSGEYIYAIQYRKIDAPAWFARSDARIFGLANTNSIAWEPYVVARHAIYGKPAEGGGDAAADTDDATDGDDVTDGDDAADGDHATNGDDATDDGPRLCAEGDIDYFEDMDHEAFVLDEEEIWCLND